MIIIILAILGTILMIIEFIKRQPVGDKDELTINELNRKYNHLIALAVTTYSDNYVVVRKYTSHLNLTNTELAIIQQFIIIYAREKGINDDELSSYANTLTFLQKTKSSFNDISRQKSDGALFHAISKAKNEYNEFIKYVSEGNISDAYDSFVATMNKI